MNSSELERAEDAECEAQRAAAGRRRVEDAVGRLEAREAVSGAHSAGEWIARWEQLSPGQRFEWAERIIADRERLTRVERLVDQWDGEVASHEYAPASAIRAVEACLRDLSSALSGCPCPPCPGRGNDGHGMTHCAECCFGSGVVADEDCPKHGRAVLTEGGA